MLLLVAINLRLYTVYILDMHSTGLHGLGSLGCRVR